MRLSAAAFLLVLFVAGASAICFDSDVDHNFNFVSRGDVCDGVNPRAPFNTTQNLPITDPERGCTKCCKNFLSCMPNGTMFTCQEISQNMTCDVASVPEGVNPCGPFMKCMPVSDGLSQCFFERAVENGGVCSVDDQCVSGICGLPAAAKASNTSMPATRCLPTGAGTLNGPCRNQTDCPAGQFCNVTGGVCANPVSGDCSAVADAYDAEIAEYPSFVCKPGSGCLRIPLKKGGYNYKCTPYYQTSKKGSVCYKNNWWNCEFGFYCNLTTADQGTCLITNQNGAIGDQCKYFPLSDRDQSECYWGTACSCFAGKSATAKAGKCNRMYNTNCQIQLNNLVDCIIKSKCPHDPIQLLGGNASPFTASVILGSCIQVKCPTQHANLIKCQNDIDNPKSNLSPAFVPKTYPNNAYSDKENGLHGWEIGLIIVGVAVAIIIVVVIVVAVVRRKSSNGQYTPLE